MLRREILNHVIVLGPEGCLTCHKPHSPRSTEIAVDGEAPATVFDEQHDFNLPSETTLPQQIASQVKSPRSFLRREGSHLCVICHEKMADFIRVRARHV